MYSQKICSNIPNIVFQIIKFSICRKHKSIFNCSISIFWYLYSISICLVCFFWYFICFSYILYMCLCFIYFVYFVFLVYSVYLVYLVYFVYFVYFVLLYRQPSSLASKSKRSCELWAHVRDVTCNQERERRSPPAELAQQDPVR